MFNWTVKVSLDSETPTSPDHFYSLKHSEIVKVSLDSETPTSPDRLEHNIEIHGFRPSRPCLIVEVLETWAKFL